MKMGCSDCPAAGSGQDNTGDLPPLPPVVRFIRRDQQHHADPGCAAVLAHLKHKGKTNTALLAATILKLAGDKGFFIQQLQRRADRQSPPSS